MVCSTSGYSYPERIYYYAYCDSTDNQVFENDIKLTRKYIYFNSGYSQLWKEEIISRDDNEVDDAISINDIFANKWVLYKSDIQNVLRSNNVYFYETHIFYKVSSD